MVRAIVTVCVHLLADDANRTTEDDSPREIDEQGLLKPV